MIVEGIYVFWPLQGNGRFPFAEECTKVIRRRASSVLTVKDDGSSYRCLRHSDEEYTQSENTLR